MIYPFDTARTRRTDPITSHIAGDLSSANLHRTRLAVLQLVRQEGELIGSELNDLYLLRSGRHGWRQVAWDTPRKRAGELFDEGFLASDVCRPAFDKGHPERVYTITAAGLALLGVDA